jgi:hypothetical protein
MLSEKPFQIAIVISLIIHTTIFLKLPWVNSLLARRDTKAVEVTYIKIKPKPESSSLKLYNRAELLSAGRPVASDKMIAPPPDLKTEKMFKEVRNIPIEKPELLKADEIAMVKKKITLPELLDEKTANPVYLNYYQIIREAIKQAAYRNYSRMVNGEVYLSFIISNHGQLKHIRVNEEKSTPLTYLKETAKKSIFDASPFPRFPEDLDYPELSFNVIVSFEVE